MDPVAAILAALEQPSPPDSMADHQARATVAGWLRAGGFRPMVEEISAEAARRGIELPAGWLARARYMHAAG